MTTFQLPAQFFQVFTDQVNNAQKSVFIQSLTLEVGGVMDSLAPALMAAAKRGVHVELHIDWIARDYVHGKISLTPRIKPAKRRYAAELHLRNKQMILKLKEAGVIVQFVNKPDWLAKMLAIAGRNHIKMYMVDEKVVWIGGVNILDMARDHLDFMVGFDEPVLIQTLKRVFFATKEHDEIVAFSPDSSLLVDGGKRGKSTIYEHALEMIETANTSIVFVSQFVPEGKLLSALVEKAKAGCVISVYTSPVTMMQFSQWPYKLTYTRCKKALTSVNVEVTHLSQKVHAKLLIVDDRAAIFGSHNLVETGINLGTAEVAIKTTDANLLNQLIRFVQLFHGLDSAVHHG